MQEAQKQYGSIQPWFDYSLDIAVPVLKKLEGTQKSIVIEDMLKRDPSLAYPALITAESGVAVVRLGPWNVDVFFKQASKEYHELKEIMVSREWNSILSKTSAVYSVLLLERMLGSLAAPGWVQGVLNEHIEHLTVLPNFGYDSPRYFELDESQMSYFIPPDHPDSDTVRKSLLDHMAQEHQRAQSWLPTPQLWPPKIPLDQLVQSAQLHEYVYQSPAPEKFVPTRFAFRLYNNPGKKKPTQVKTPRKAVPVLEDRNTLVDKAIDLSRYYGPIDAFNKAQQSGRETYVTAQDKPELFERLRKIFNEAHSSPSELMQQFRKLAAEGDYSVHSVSKWLEEFSRGDFDHAVELVEFIDRLEKMLKGKLIKIARKLKRCKD